MLSGRSLGEALSALSARVASQTGVPIECVVSGDSPLVLPEDCQLALLGVAHEALTNVRKHARSSAARVHLDWDGDGEVSLAIEDDGRGFDPEAPRQGAGGRDSRFGLLSMRERIEALGGAMAVVSAPDEGTVVRVSLPLPAERRRSP